MKRVWVAVAAAVLAAAVAGCGSDQETAREFQRVLPRLIGPAQRYELRVSGTSGARLRQVKVRASRLAMAEDLVLDSAAIDLAEVRYNRKNRELLGVDRADFSAILLQEDLNLHLKSRTSLVRGLRLRITPDGVQLRGSADIPGVRLPVTPEFTLDGTLGIDDAGRLRFEPSRIRVIGIEVPAVAAQALATQINPLVDLTTGRLPVYLRSVEVGNGEVRLAGRALLRPGRYPDADL